MQKASSLSAVRQCRHGFASWSMAASLPSAKQAWEQGFNLACACVEMRATSVCGAGRGTLTKSHASSSRRTSAGPGSTGLSSRRTRIRMSRVPRTTIPATRAPCARGPSWSRPARSCATTRGTRERRRRRVARRTSVLAAVACVWQQHLTWASQKRTGLPGAASCSNVCPSNCACRICCSCAS